MARYSFFLVVRGGNEIHPYNGAHELSFPFENIARKLNVSMMFTCAPMVTRLILDVLLRRVILFLSIFSLFITKVMSILSTFGLYSKNIDELLKRNGCLLIAR